MAPICAAPVHPFVVIPGPAEGRSPESIIPLFLSRPPGLWIPDSRFAASGMTKQSHSSPHLHPLKDVKSAHAVDQIDQTAIVDEHVVAGRAFRSRRGIR